MKTYVLTVSRYFPKTHKRAGEPTMFIESIEDLNKIHTIRGNYELWAKRMEQVQKGEAIISLRYWSGKPYNSKQVEFKQLTKEDGVGVQKLENPKNFVYAPIDGTVNNWEFVAENDGLTFLDFEDWFKAATTEPMAVIHFTKFRY